jgi:hypothetical protein
MTFSFIFFFNLIRKVESTSSSKKNRSIDTAEKKRMSPQRNDENERVKELRKGISKTNKRIWCQRKWNVKGKKWCDVSTAERKGRLNEAENALLVELLCSVCINDSKQYAIVPCGHKFCKTCIDTIKSMSHEQRRCPTCRGTIDSSIKIFD